MKGTQLFKLAHVICKWKGHNSSRIVSRSFTMFTDLKSCVPFIYKDHMSWFEELCPLHLQRSHELIWRVVSPSFTKINDFKSCVPFISKNNLLKNCVPFIYKDHIVCLQIHVSHKSDEGHRTLKIIELCKWRGHNSSNQLMWSL
jgi:hypothetical protein